MPATKYKFNPDSLSFDKIRLGLRAMFFRLLAYFTGSVIFALIYWAIFASFFDSPKEKALKREVEQMTIQYDMIHREMANVEKMSLMIFRKPMIIFTEPSLKLNPSRPHCVMVE